MKIKEYIQYRYNLESIDINDLEKIDYKKENNDYKTLISVAQTYSTKKDYFNITYIFFIIGIIFALFFSLGYIDNKSKEINILEYILFVIAIPFTFMLTISIMKIYSKLKKKKIDFINLLEMPFFIEKFKKFYIEKEALRILSPFYWNIITITYSITSILLLLKYTAVNKYSFYWSSTWISKEIIFLFSKPVELLPLNIIPKELEQENIYSFVSSNPMWLWFLIVLTLILILIPKILFLIFNKINSEKKLKESFISSNKSKIILNKVNFKNDERTDTEDNSINFKTFIFWPLTKTIKAIIKFFIKTIVRVLTKKESTSEKAMAALKKDFEVKLDNSLKELSVILYKIVNEEEKCLQNSYSHIDEVKEKFKNKLFNTEKSFYKYVEKEWGFNKLEKELEDYKNIDIHSEKLNETGNLFKKYLLKESPKINLLVEESNIILKLNDEYKYDFLKKMYFYIELISLRSYLKKSDFVIVDLSDDVSFDKKDNSYIKKILKENNKDKFTEDLEKIMREIYKKKNCEIFL